MANSGIYEEDYGQDSDHDSLYADADSPTDGYFEQRPFPRSQFVENSSVAAEATAKAQEAAESRASNTGVHSSQPTSPTSPSRSPTWTNTDEQTPLLDAGPAPPDYAAATAHRTTSEAASSSPSESASHRSRNYGSIPPTQPAPAPTSNDYQWPFGNRGNPFNDLNFPFGAAGAPWNNPQFPLGRNNNMLNHSRFESGVYHNNGNPVFRSGSAHRDTGMPIFPVGPPQSMGGVDEPQYGAQGRQDEEAAGGSRHQIRKQRRSRKLLANCCRPWSLLSWLVLFVILSVVILTTISSKSENPSSGEKDPRKTPNDPQLPQVPIQPDEPSIPSFPANRSLTHCPFQTLTDTHRFDFSSEEFHFIELMDSPSGIDISGTVWIQPAPEEQDVDIRVFVSYATTKPWRVTVKRFVQNKNTLRLDFPELQHQADANSYKSSCLDVAVAIQVRDGVRLSELSLTSANLDIISEEGLLDSSGKSKHSASDIADTSSITAIRGKVNLAYFSSRETVVDIISGSIQGHFALRDLLVLKSQSGSISVEIDPKEADYSEPASAEVAITSTSGKIHVALPLSGQIPDRDYRTRVESVSGSISGDYYLGTTTSISTVSSSISAKILPYDWSDWSASLRTGSVSGHTYLEVLPCYKYPDRAVGHMHSYHKTGSSSLQIKYPAQWSGTIDGDSMSGSVHVHGKGVVVDVDEQYGHIARHLTAHKGDGSSTMDFRSRSGSVNIAIGD